MSSTYRRICLSHKPPLILDEEVAINVPPEQPSNHPECEIALGRWSGALIDLWLPRGDLLTPINGWQDVSWMRRFPNLAAMIMNREI
jgi:hypothetical protein